MNATNIPTTSGLTTVKKEENESEPTPEMNQNNAALVKFEDVAAFLPPFNGRKKIITWLNEFEKLSQVFNMSDLQKLLFCRRLLQGHAHKFLMSMDIPENFAQLKRILIHEFEEDVNGVELHRRLTNRKKLPQESHLDYFYVMREISALGDIDESTVMRYIVEGVNASPANQALLMTANTFGELKQLLKNLDAIRPCHQPNIMARPRVPIPLSTSRQWLPPRMPQRPWRPITSEPVRRFAAPTPYRSYQPPAHQIRDRRIHPGYFPTT